MTGKQFGLVIEGLDLHTVDDLAAAIRLVYHRSEAIEPLVRWTLSNPPARTTERPHRGERLSMLRAALNEVLEPHAPTEAAYLERLALLLPLPPAALYWKDYLGLSADESADVSAWALLTLSAQLREPLGHLSAQVDTPRD